MHEEGWYTDPYGVHEARWMSDGQPTGLVRDDSVEATENVPDGPWTSTPQRRAAEGPGGLAIADVLEANNTSEPSTDYSDAAEESIDSSS